MSIKEIYAKAEENAGKSICTFCGRADENGYELKSNVFLCMDCVEGGGPFRFFIEWVEELQEELEAKGGPK